MITKHHNQNRPKLTRTYQSSLPYYLKQRVQYQPAVSEHSILAPHLIQNLGCARISWIIALYLTLCWIFVMEWISSSETPRLRRPFSRATLRIIFLLVVFRLPMFVCSSVVLDVLVFFNCFGWLSVIVQSRQRVHISTWGELGSSGWHPQRTCLKWRVRTKTNSTRERIVWTEWKRVEARHKETMSNKAFVPPTRCMASSIACKSRKSIVRRLAD